MRLLVGLLVAVLLPVSLAGPAAGAPRHHRDVVPCSRGLVALTFDDGPSATVTPELVRLLQRLDVPATFFMVGSRVAAAPETARLVERAGFAIGNHTWEHTDLTIQTNSEIRRALETTWLAMVEAGLHPTRLARPPYGAVDDRVSRLIDKMGYTSVLWTIDSRDWAGGTSKQIREKVLGAVRPHRTNVVLQHDGVTNSPATLRALPDEIAALRRRGYCFAELDLRGNPTPPVPVPTISTDVRRADEGGTVGVTVRLDRPTSRPTTIRVEGWAPRTVRFPVGDTLARLRLRVPRDRLDEAREELVLSAGDSSTSVLVRDLDAPPGVRVVGATVTASPLVATEALVGIRLDQRSGRDVRVLLRTPDGRRWVSVPAGATSAVASVPVPPGRVDQPTRRRPVEIVRAVNADPAGSATITVRPPIQTRAEAVRDLIARVRWPAALVGRLPAIF